MDTQEKDDLLDLYEGNESYIFISYSHLDLDELHPIIEWLHEHGYRIWYDKGIHPGTEWPEMVAGRLSDCAVFLAFLSKNYLASQNCVRELHYAVSKRKQLLTVILDNVKMSPGVEMQLCTSQAIRKKDYSTKGFYQVLGNTDVIANCRFSPVKEDSISAAPAPDAFSGKPGRSAPAGQKQGRPSSDGQKVKMTLLQKFITPGRRKTSPVYPVLSGMVIIILAVFLLCGIYQKAHTCVIAGTKYSTSDTIICLEDCVFTEEDAANLLKMNNLSSLTIKHSVLNEIFVDAIGKMSSLNSLRIYDSAGITDYHFLQELHKLYTLTLSDMVLSDSDLPMGSLPTSLVTLEITGNATLTSSAFLSGLDRLQYLSLQNNGLQDVSELSSFRNLAEVNLSDNKISVIREPMQSLELYELHLDRNELVDLSGLNDLTTLKTFSLSENKTPDGFESCDLGNELLFLSKSSNTLKTVDLSKNFLSGEDLYDILGSCIALKNVYLSGNPINGDLQFLANSYSMVELHANDCAITGLSGLHSDDSLTTLYLSNNELTDLKNMPSFRSGSYCLLDLRNNRLKSLNDLPSGEYYRVLFNGNPLEKVDWPTDISVSYAAFDYVNEMTAEDALASCSFVYVAKTPADHKVALKKASAGRLYFGLMDIDGNIVEE